MSQFGNMSGGTRFSMFPPVIKYLIFINAGIYVFQYFFLKALSFGGTNLFALTMNYLALQPIDSSALSLTAGGGFYPWQLLTYQFLHGGFFHLFFNLFALWMFGVEMENRWGSKKFLVYYLLSGIGAGVVHMIISPFFGGMGPTVGASGSIYGILLAYGLTYPNRPILAMPFFIPIPAKYFVMIFAGFELFSGLTGGSGIAHFAHLGGAATGFILFKYGDKWGIYDFLGNMFSSSRSTSSASSYSVGSEYKSTSSSAGRGYFVNWETPKQSKEKYYSDVQKKEESGKSINIDGQEINQSTIDIILDKISASGYQNLTDKEKYILNELSKKL